MITNTGIDTKELLAGTHATSSEMAVYLTEAYLNGDQGEDLCTLEYSGDGAARYGRRILTWDDSGFYTVIRYDTVEEAKRAMILIHRVWDDDDELI